MRKTVFVPVVIALSLMLTACSSESNNSADNVEQPTEDLSGGNIVDPTASDEGSKLATEECLAGSAITGRPVRVVSTVAPITSLIASVVGDTGTTIQGVVPEGTNSHTFEPPPSAVGIVEKADIIFINGLGLEDPTRDLADANAKNAVVCELGTATLPEGGWLYDFSFPKEGGKPNPHLWTNPPMVLSYVTLIRDVLVKADPANTATYDDNYVKISKVIMDMDEAMKTASATILATDRKLLTYHDAYAYFALRYEFEVLGAIQPQSFEEPSPKDIADLIEQVKSQNVKAIFGSEVFPSPVLEQIGKETGVRYIDVLRDDDLIGKPGDKDHSWAGLMKFNFITMVEALGGDATALKAVNTDDGVVDKASYPQ
jgi:ABC-type Zn uptake system ZnuABC Zn-binding protein ZnuA